MSKFPPPPNPLPPGEGDVDFDIGSSKMYLVSQYKNTLSPEEGALKGTGRYRVLFDVDEMIRIILVEDIKKRDERTY